MPSASRKMFKGKAAEIAATAERFSLYLLLYKELYLPSESSFSTNFKSLHKNCSISIFIFTSVILLTVFMHLVGEPEKIFQLGRQ